MSLHFWSVTWRQNTHLSNENVIAVGNSRWNMSQGWNTSLPALSVGPGVTRKTAGEINVLRKVFLYMKNESDWSHLSSKKTPRERWWGKGFEERIGGEEKADIRSKKKYIKNSRQLKLKSIRQISRCNWDVISTCNGISKAKHLMSCLKSSRHFEVFAEMCCSAWAGWDRRGEWERMALQFWQTGGNENAIQQSPTRKPKDAPDERKELFFWVSSTYYLAVFGTMNFHLKWI